MPSTRYATSMSRSTLKSVNGVNGPQLAWAAFTVLVSSHVPCGNESMRRRRRTTLQRNFAASNDEAGLIPTATKGLLAVALVLGVQSSAFAQHSSLVGAITAVERSLAACKRSYVVHVNRLPLGEDRDFCTVPPNDRIGGDDVSKREGRQLDAIDVIRQLQWFVERNRATVSGDGRYRVPMKELSTDLAACLAYFSSYRGGWGHSSSKHPDYCEFAAGRSTRQHYPNLSYTNSPNRYSLREVATGGQRILRSLRAVLGEWGYE